MVTRLRNNPQMCSEKTGRKILQNLEENVIEGCYFLKSTYQNSVAAVFWYVVTALSLATLLKTKFWHRCFPVNFTFWEARCFRILSSWALDNLYVSWNYTTFPTRSFLKKSSCFRQSLTKMRSLQKVLWAKLYL